MINGVDVLGTLGIFAVGFIMGALFFFTLRYMILDDRERNGDE